MGTRQLRNNPQMLPLQFAGVKTPISKMRSFHGSEHNWSIVYREIACSDSSRSLKISGNDPVKTENPDPGLFTSNKGRFLKFKSMNILDNFQILL